MNSTQKDQSWQILNNSTNNSIKTALIAVCFFVVSASQATAQTFEASAGSSGWVESFDQAVAESESSGKPIMFVFSGSDWCSYCQRLEHEVFRTPEFESWSGSNVIKVMVDFPRYHNLSGEIATQNENLKEHFAGQLKGYPTILMVQADGTVIGRSGYVAGGPIPWIAKTDSILRRSQHRLADTSFQNQ